MVIKPSAEIRNNYRKVADFCIQTGEPVYLTNNGEGELVIMSIQAWEEERQRIKAEAALMHIEAKEAAGVLEFTSARDSIYELRDIVKKTTAEGL